MAFTVINGEVKIGFNTDAVVFMNRAKTDTTYFINLHLSAGGKAELAFNNKELRDKAYETLMADMANGSVKPSYDFGITDYEQPKQVITVTDSVRVRGYNFDAVQVTNGLNTEGKPMSLNVNLPNAVKVRGTEVDAVQVTNGFTTTGGKVAFKITHD